MGFKEIKPSEINGSVFSDIGSKWMLISAQKPDGSINTMTASWGTMGVLWNKNIFVCFIRPQRFTHEFTEASDKISISFFGEEHRDALRLCGKVSGRDCFVYTTQYDGSEMKISVDKETGVWICVEEGDVAYTVTKLELNADVIPQYR